MPVQTPHPSYTYYAPEWAKIRTFLAGARAVRARGEAYLPKTKGWTDEEYNAYKARAEVYGAADRTVDGLDGAIFRKAPRTDFQDPEKLADNITLSDKSLIVFLRGVVREVIPIGRHGVLIEHTGREDGAGNPVAKANVDRPYIVPYVAEAIINWDTKVIEGETKLTLVVLRESISIESPSDPFVKVNQFRYRVLRLVDGKYVVEIWSEDTAAQSPVTPIGSSTPAEKIYKKTQEFIPSRRGEPLDRIPFVFIGPSGQDPEPEKPPLLDIVDLCILHYMTSADYAHGLHWVALPTPYICGSNDKDKIGIGPTSAIVLDDPTAKVGMLEFTGTGLSAVKDRLEGLEAKIAALGARILEEQKKQAESGEALKLRQSGDASVLAGISDAVSRAAEAILKIVLWWSSTDSKEQDVTIELNMDFFGQQMDPQTIVALMQAQQANLMSRETFVWNLKRGEMLPEDHSVEDELAKIGTDPVMPEPSATP